MKTQSEGALNGVLGYTQDKVIATDFRDDVCTSIFDAEASIAFDSTFVKIVAWYDNEWDCSNKCLEMVRVVASNSTSIKTRLWTPCACSVQATCSSSAKERWLCSWTDIAGMTMLRSVMGAVKIGNRALVHLPGHSPPGRGRTGSAGRLMHGQGIEPWAA